MRRTLTALIAGLAILLSTPAIASADGLSLPVDTVIRASEGSVIEVGRIPVDTDLAGPLCVWNATVTNQESVHIGNNIIVRSGTSELLLAGVEDAELKATSNSGSVYLADEVIVELIMGPDEVFSGGLTLEIDYNSCQQPTTTTPPPVDEPDATVDDSTSTTESTEVVDDTTADSVAPAGPTTIETTTTIAVAPAAPILPVTGNRNILPFVSLGLALLAVGTMLIRSTRTAS